MDVHTQNHLKDLRNALLYRQSELRSRLDAAQVLDQVSTLPAGEVADRKDLAGESQQIETSEAQTQREIEELAQVEQALARLDEGIYGDCLACGQPIPLERLFVQPAAPRCAACQAQAEHRH